MSFIQQGTTLTARYSTLFIIAFSALLYAGSSINTWESDSSIYATSAKQIWEGKSLYNGTWQDKPPVSLLIFALPFAVINHGLLGPQLMNFMLGVFQWLLLRTLSPVAIKKWDFLLLPLILLFPFLRRDFTPLMTEHIANPFILAEFLVAWRIINNKQFTILDGFTWGVSTILVFHCRQNMVASSAVPLLACLLNIRTQNKTRIIGGAILGAIAGWGIIFGILLATQCSISDYIYTVYKYPGRYAAAEGVSFSSKLRIVGILFDVTLRSSIILLLWFLPLVFIPKREALFWLASGALLLAACVSPFKPYEHYFLNLLPIIVIAWANALHQLPDYTSKALASVLCVLIINTAFTAFYIYNGFNYTRQINNIVKIVDDAAGANEAIWATGRFSECIMLNARSPLVNTYVFENQLNSYVGMILPKSIDVIYEEYLTNPPRVIATYEKSLLTKNENTDRIINGLFAKYKWNTIAKQDGWIIYRRAD